MKAGMVTARTPEPWTYVSNGIDDRRIDGASGRTVADLSPLLDDAETAANASIMTAAPRLLKAVQDLLLTMDLHAGECECSQCEAVDDAKRVLKDLDEEVIP